MIRTILLFNLILLSWSFFAQIPTNGLIGGWPFSGNANDMSGNNNNGTVYGTTLTSDRFGNANSAYNFNGSTNYIQMLNAGPTGTVSRSVSFWAKTTNTLIQVGFNYGDAGNGGIYQVLFNYNCQGVGIDNSNSALIHGNNSLTDNQWHHIVAVYNSTVGSTIGNVDLYVDAVLQPGITCFVTSTNSPITSNNFYPIAIGRSSNSAARFFKGDLDDFYFYDRPLTLSEIQTLYNYSPCSSAPSAPTSVSGNTNICLGTTNIYSVTPVAGATSYSWNLPGGWSGTSSTNSISTTSGISGGVVSVAAQNPCGISAFNTLNVAALGSPTINISGNSNICIGNVISIAASGADTYVWSNGATSSNITVSPSVTTTYSVTGTNSLNCSSSISTTINVSTNQAPIISLAGPGETCEGQSVNLGSNGASTYTWLPGNLTGFYVTVSPSVTTTYTVIGTAANGCTNFATYTQSVSVCTSIMHQNNKNSLSLSPNPVISTLIITGLNDFSKIELCNNLGEVLLARNVLNPTEEIAFSELPQGVYFVKIFSDHYYITRRIIKE